MAKSKRLTWIHGHMHLPPDVNALDIDWCDDLNPLSQRSAIVAPLNDQQTEGFVLRGAGHPAMAGKRSKRP